MCHGQIDVTAEVKDIQGNVAKFTIYLYVKYSQVNLFHWNATKYPLLEHETLMK